MAETARIDLLARALFDAETSGSAIAPLTEEWPEMAISDAYAVQRAGWRLREARGATLVGRKVGLTSEAMQEMLKVDQPDFGYLTDRMVFATGDAVPGGRLIAARVEAEIAFRMKAPIDPRAGVAEVLAATEEVAPALEVIDSRVADWKIGIADTIADNASSACVVLGDFVPLGDIDLAGIEMEMIVTADGERTSVQGRGAAVLGHPAAAVAWLARALATYGTEEIVPGDVVLPGAMARAVPVAIGSTVTASFGVLGSVSARFSADR